MSKQFVCYEIATGRVLRAGLAADDDFAGQAGAGEAVIEGVASEMTHYVAGGALMQYTADEQARRAMRPPHSASWDIATRQWIDERDLAEARILKWAEIKRARNAAEASGFEWGGNSYDSDLSSVARLLVTIMRAVVEPGGFVSEWTRSDNSVVTLRATDLASLCKALQAHIQAQHDRAMAARAAIDAATSVASVDAISW